MVDTAQYSQEELASLLGDEPLKLVNLINNWPILEAANADTSQLCGYLIENTHNRNVTICRVKESENGFIQYINNGTAFNFNREQLKLHRFLEYLPYARDSLLLQSTPVSYLFDNFCDDNPMKVLGDIEPRIWLGGLSRVAAHYDDATNIACVVAGDRRFKLFPPEQIQNLYIGPLERTPAGAPMSLVDFHNPDFERFPRFKEALKHCIDVPLKQGESIYIPALWWHHVETTSNGVNCLVNYWQGGAISKERNLAPQDAILFSLLALKDLPENEKKKWQHFFNFYLFGDAHQVHGHIPEEAKGVLGDLSGEMRSKVIAYLANKLKDG